MSRPSFLPRPPFGQTATSDIAAIHVCLDFIPDIALDNSCDVRAVFHQEVLAVFRLVFRLEFRQQFHQDYQAEFSRERREAFTHDDHMDCRPDSRPHSHATDYGKAAELRRIA